MNILSCSYVMFCLFVWLVSGSRRKQSSRGSRGNSAMAWAWKVSKLLTLVALLPYRIAAEDEDEETEFSEA